MKWHGNSMTRPSGGRKRPHSKKKKSEIGREPTETRIGEDVIKTIDARGGERKIRALKTNKANYIDGGETVEVEIDGVVENRANPNYARRDIITKGAVIDTAEGRARVTSRPGQNGVVNAVAKEE